MSYKVVYPNISCKKSFEKVFSAIPQNDQDAILKTLKSFCKNPRPHGYLQLSPPLKVSLYLAQYRFRIGNYRIFYDIKEKEKKVYIFAIRRRNEKTYR